MEGTTVVNLRYRTYDVYIGRPSEWGNPYAVGRDGDRDDVIRKHMEYLEKRIAEDPDFLEHMKKELGGKILGCFCKPKACHGDNYVTILKRYGY